MIAEGGCGLSGFLGEGPILQRTEVRPSRSQEPNLSKSGCDRLSGWLTRLICTPTQPLLYSTYSQYSSSASNSFARLNLCPTGASPSHPTITGPIDPLSWPWPHKADRENSSPGGPTMAQRCAYKCKCINKWKYFILGSGLPRLQVNVRLD